MSTPFETRIHRSLSDPALQAALDGNAERRLKARQAAYASLPDDLQTFRHRAHAVRADVIANLERYQEQFVANARANGMVVHLAADAEQAVKTVLQIARFHGARLIAKSKTMVGEEIEINRALEAAGMQAVETDLGEYIVQLRHEPPAHIITPAVHLSRAQVGQTFQEKLGVPFTDDIPTLTAIAHDVLRQTFLNADIGISGVNFGVAETGALCMVTNEGNGRMVTTLPPVHIALMGIERLVPTLDDLALMLALLPRSATGQKLTVYTNLMRGPRRPDEPDGPLERHLVLVDNGRSALRRSPLAESLYCIRCGACLNACPVFRELGGHAYVGSTGQTTPYPGPIGSVISAGMFGEPEFGLLARATSLCGACQEACPVDIDLPKLLLRVRAGMVAREEPDDMGKAESAPAKPLARRGTHVPKFEDFGLRVFTWFALSPRRYHFAQRSLGFVGRTLAPRSAFLHMPAATGWGLSRDIVRPPARPFRDWMAQENYITPAQPDNGQPGQEIGAHHTLEMVPVAPKAAEIPPDQLVERFEQELTALGGQVIRCESMELLVERMVALLQENEIDALMSWEAGQLPDGLPAALQANGIQLRNEPDPQLRAGLTGVIAAAAETGTLALAAGPGRLQAASLLTELHLAVLRARDIRPTLLEVLKLDAIRHASTATLVTGPSRTADIEMTLTIGVHGPRQVYVFCLDSD
jgi:L-lactate dehydrogenase complex protein LldF